MDTEEVNAETKRWHNRARVQEIYNTEEKEGEEEVEKRTVEQDLERIRGGDRLEEERGLQGSRKSVFLSS